MEGHPRYAIHVSALVFQLAHAYARQAGYKSTSDWLRSLLWTWDEEPLEPRARRTRHLGVRLSPPLQRRLARIAEVSDTTLSEAFAILVERALLAGVDHAPAHDRRSKPKPKRTRAQVAPAATDAATTDAATTDAATTPADAPEIPAPRDYQRWSQVILDAARATRHKFGPGRAFIAGMLEELIERFQPDEPRAFRDMVRAMLPELNRRDLVPLSRADLVASMDPQLVRDSAIQHLNATFHFIKLD